MTVDELLAKAPELVGREVSVTGPLRVLRTLCTALACDNSRCCNDCRGVLVLGDPAGAHVILRHRSCYGDDTGLCCPVIGDGRVVRAVGTVVGGEPIIGGRAMSSELATTRPFVLTGSTDADAANWVGPTICAVQ